MSEKIVQLNKEIIWGKLVNWSVAAWKKLEWAAGRKI